MSATRLAAVLAVALACTAQSPAPGAPAVPDGAALTGDLLLARIKTAFRSHLRPPFVAYTVVRRDRHAGVTDLDNSYTLKVWCRTADRSALVRRAWRGKAYGDLEHETVMFDRALDPGPPTADMFEKRLFGPSPLDGARANTARPAAPALAPLAAQEAMTEIGRVSAHDGDYRVDRVAREGAVLHVWLAPRTEPERNRLDEIWVDASNYDLRRALVRDHLYFDFGIQSIAEEFDVRFRTGPGDVPLIASIHGYTPGGASYETDYTFENVTFPESLPDWYFAPKQYGMHRADAPA